MYSVHYSVHCTVYSVQCTVYSTSTRTKRSCCLIIVLVCESCMFVEDLFAERPICTLCGLLQNLILSDPHPPPSHSLPLPLSLPLSLPTPPPPPKKESFTFPFEKGGRANAYFLLGFGLCVMVSLFFGFILSDGQLKSCIYGYSIFTYSILFFKLINLAKQSL